jgi:competence protein ComGC
MFSGTAQHSTGFPSGLSMFFLFLVISVCLLVRVTVVDKNKTVGIPE